MDKTNIRKSILTGLFFYVNLLLANPPGATTLLWQLHWNNQPIHPDRFYALNNKDSATIETVRFYVSGIQLLQNNQLVWKEENSIHLIDAGNNNSLHCLLNIPSGIQFNQVKFNLGIDSVTNVSGMKSGDLDPLNGMYWTWQSGYINFKLEGKSAACVNSRNDFQFHLGGYQQPHCALQTVVLAVKDNESISIGLDLGKLLSSLYLPKQNHIMLPNKEAVLMSEKIAQLFTVQ